MGTKYVWVANLPPEVSNDMLHASLASFGKVLNIHTEMWSKAYRYHVSNGVRQFAMHLTRHLHSHLTIAGHRILLLYEGQPATCCGCGELGNFYQTCPACQTTGTDRQDPPKATCSSIVTNKTSLSGRQSMETNANMEQHEAECNNVYTTTAAIISDREIDYRDGNGTTHDNERRHYTRSCGRACRRFKRHTTPRRRTGREGTEGCRPAAK